MNMLKTFQMKFERSKDIKTAMNIGMKKYPHVIRAYEKGDLRLDDLIEFCRSGGKRFNSKNIRITVANPEDIDDMHRYWKEGGKLPDEYRILSLFNYKGTEIVIRGKIYTVP